MIRFGLTRVAFGSTCLDDIALQIAAVRIGSGSAAHVPVTSRRTPRRDLSGGSLFWIIGHRLIARQAIMGVDEVLHAEGGIAILRLSPDLVQVRTTAFRAHQGWRYIAEPDWPTDLARSDSPNALPPEIEADLEALKLL